MPLNRNSASSPPMGDCVKDHFRVTCRMKLHAFLLEFPAQFAEVVDLSVVDKDISAVLSCHRLPSCRRKIQNRKTTKAKHHRSPSLHMPSSSGPLRDMSAISRRKIALLESKSPLLPEKFNCPTMAQMMTDLTGMQQAKNPFPIIYLYPSSQLTEIKRKN